MNRDTQTARPVPQSDEEIQNEMWNSAVPSLIID